MLTGDIHKWAGIGAAIFWIIQAATGILLSFHFEIEDALKSTGHVASNYQAIEQRLDTIDEGGSAAKVNWIWTTAGLPDRYVISYTDRNDADQKMWIDGAGEVLKTAPAAQHSVLSLMREIHIDLLAGNTGQWVMAITGAVLITNLLLGLFIAWPRNINWKRVLKPVDRGGKAAKAYSWHRAIGLWAVIPALLVASTGTLILFEHGIRDLIGAPENSAPPNPQTTDAPIGWAKAAKTAVAAIPGSRFAGGTMPSREDASYHVWVHAPGELYRGGYGASLVIVDANAGGVRAVFDSSKADAKQAILSSFYPLHTGAAGGTIGRLLAMMIGFWLLTMTILGLLLWWRRRPKRPSKVIGTGETPA